MPDPTDHWLYRLPWWALHHGDQLLPVFWGLWVLAIAVALAGAVLQAGARWFVIFSVWRRVRRWWRSRADHPGGAGGHRVQYQAVMQSAGWRRRRSQAIRQAGRRCQACGARGPLDVHHLSYAHLGEERPYELAVLCEACHQRAHGR